MKIKSPTTLGIDRTLEILARMPQTEAPVFSCFINLEQGKEQALLVAESNFLELRRALPQQYLQHASEAFEEFKRVLSADVDNQSRGFAFLLSNRQRTFLSLGSNASPLKNCISYWKTSRLKTATGATSQKNQTATTS